MNEIITMRKLLAAKNDAKVLRKLQQLNIGVSYQILGGICGSKWTIGATEPTLEWVKIVRKNIHIIDDFCNLIETESWLDIRLTLQLDWSRHFGTCPTGPMM